MTMTVGDGPTRPVARSTTWRPPAVLSGVDGATHRPAACDEEVVLAACAERAALVDMCNSALDVYVTAAPCAWYVLCFPVLVEDVAAVLLDTILVCSSTLD